MTGPRPWYISLTAKWKEGEGFESFMETVMAVLNGQLPYHHSRIDELSLHSTLFAVAELSAFPPKGSAESYAEAVLEELLKSGTVASQLRSTFRGFRVRADKIRCWDTGTVVQFDDSDDIRLLRKQVFDVLEKPVDALGRDRAGFRAMLKDPDKSAGPRFFGSVARSLLVSNVNQLRWEETLSHDLFLDFRVAHLLVSDDALTNLRSANRSLKLGTVPA